ncbi:MAG: pilus assembly protein PilZ [Limnobacter sp.]|nr:pilus assembly protein PilZ [Limnobacter sp.]
MGTSAESQKVWMHNLLLTNDAHAAQCFMPFIKQGGLFLETDQKYTLGDSVFVLVTVGEMGKKFPVNGKVVWINSDNSRSDRPVGVGIQFPSDASGEAVRLAIEKMIGKMRSSSKSTATL